MSDRKWHTGSPNRGVSSDATCSASGSEFHLAAHSRGQPQAPCAQGARSDCRSASEIEDGEYVQWLKQRIEETDKLLLAYDRGFGLRVAAVSNYESESEAVGDMVQECSVPTGANLNELLSTWAVSSDSQEQVTVTAGAALPVAGPGVAVASLQSEVSAADAALAVVEAVSEGGAVAMVVTVMATNESEVCVQGSELSQAVPVAVQAHLEVWKSVCELKDGSDGIVAHARQEAEQGEGVVDAAVVVANDLELGGEVECFQVEAQSVKCDVNEVLVGVDDCASGCYCSCTHWCEEALVRPAVVTRPQKRVKWKEDAADAGVATVYESVVRSGDVIHRAGQEPVCGRVGVDAVGVTGNEVPVCVEVGAQLLSEVTSRFCKGADLSVSQWDWAHVCGVECTESGDHLLGEWWMASGIVCVVKQAGEGKYWVELDSVQLPESQRSVRVCITGVGKLLKYWSHTYAGEDCVSVDPVVDMHWRRRGYGELKVEEEELFGDGVKLDGHHHTGSEEDWGLTRRKELTPTKVKWKRVGTGVGTGGNSASVAQMKRPK